ncbi:MAG: IS1634 family transposase [Synergistaceae bacterium]|jgi:transposase|nr:IS1634 family transposase [Synergistaceae bacterium]
MYIACTKNHGIDYLQVHESYSVKENGSLKNRSRLIKNIGPLSRFDDGKPDYLKRLRQSFKDGKPLIKTLLDLTEIKQDVKRVNISFDLEDESDCASNPKNVGYFLLDGLYDALGIYDVLNIHKSRTKIEYDLNGLAKLLVFGRILSPDSKLETFNGKSRYVFDVASSENPVEIYRSLDCLDIAAGAIQKRMNHKIAGALGRNMEVCFYDVTNYYFEIGENDANIFDEAGNVIQEGLRKRGVSKEKRSEPIVQMGLFIDDNGLPVAYRLFPGNNIDQTTLRPAMKHSIDALNFGRVIIVADGGLNSDKNIAHILKSGNGYILSRSTKKSNKTVRKWILDENGYEWNEKRAFKVKSIARERTILDENGKKVKIKEKLICYWSKKHYDKEAHENAKFIEYLDAVIAHPDKLKDKPRKIEKFLVKKSVDKKTGEAVDTKTELSLDLDKLREYLDLLGYYTIITSEAEKSDREIINKYHGLSRIEDSFRITKNDLEGRPVFVRTPEHINAHFLLCFIALSMIRFIQYKVLRFQGKETLNMDGWESGVTAERIQRALGSFNADALPNGYYRLTKPNDDLRLILGAFGIDADLRLPTATQLRQLKYGFDKAAMA